MVKPTLMFAAGDLTRDLKQDHKRGGSAYYVHTFVTRSLTPSANVRYRDLMLWYNYYYYYY